MTHNTAPLPLGDAYWIQADQLFDGQDLLSDMAIQISDAKVAQVIPVSEIPVGANALSSTGLITPGLFDIQVNGGGDVMLNATPTIAGVLDIARAHRNFGTTALLPTVITDTPETMAAAAEAVIQTHGQNGVMGIHIEGPHISLARRGTHGSNFIRPLDETTMNVVRKLRNHGVPVLLTLAPENATPAQVSTLVELGVVVSIGHSDSDVDSVKALLEQGVSLFTHLFNAMSPMLNRAPGVTGTAINSSAYCSLICDGIHVNDDMLSLAIRARPLPDRMILISDAMQTVGGSDSFMLYGKPVTLKNGSLMNSEGSLAGAHTTMAQSLARLVSHVGVPLQMALRMAISNPAQLMGLTDKFQLLGMDVDNLLVFDAKMGCSFMTPDAVSAS